jgi:hypothetical protein
MEPNVCESPPSYPACRQNSAKKEQTEQIQSTIFNTRCYAIGLLNFQWYGQEQGARIMGTRSGRSRIKDLPDFEDQMLMSVSDHGRKAGLADGRPHLYSHPS